MGREHNHFSIGPRLLLLSLHRRRVHPWNVWMLLSLTLRAIGDEQLDGNYSAAPQDGLAFFLLSAPAFGTTDLPEFRTGGGRMRKQAAAHAQGRTHYFLLALLASD